MSTRKISLLMAAIFGLIFSPAFSQKLPVFLVKQNSLPEEVMAQLSAETAKAEITALTLTKNNKDKDVYPFTFSPTEGTTIVILNEQTGNYVVMTPVSRSLTEFQLSAFFIEELKLEFLGDAERFLVVEVSSGYLIKNVASVSTSNGEVFIPRCFYGEEENIQEALPEERIMTEIFKAKLRLISAAPDDPEVQQHIAQLEEERSYFVYRFKLPDGTMCSYDENFESE